MKKFYCFILAVSIACLIFSHNPIIASSDTPSASYLNYLKARLLMDEGKYQEAMQSLLEVIASNPSSPSPWRDLANIYMIMGQTQKALETADEIARRFPDDKETIGFLANLYAQLASYKQAAYYYEKFLEFEPGDETAMIYLANYYYLTNPEEAIKYLTRLSAQHPSNPQIFTKLAEIYEKLNFYDDAIKNYRRSLELEESPKETHLALSRLYEIMKDTAAAIAEYEAYLKEDPDNPTVTAYLGVLYFYSGETDKAKRYFERLTEISSNTEITTSAYVWLGSLYADNGDIPSAISQFEKAVRTSPSASLYKYLAELHLKQRDFKSALRTLDNAAKVDPTDHQIYFMKGLILMDIKKFSKARDEFTSSLKIKPDFEDALFYRAVSYDNLKNFKKAREDFERLLAINPRHHQAANYLAYSFAEKNIELDSALILVGNALKEAPENPAYLDTLGWIYFKKGNLAESEKILDETCKIVKSDWEILYHTARIKEEISKSVSNGDEKLKKSREAAYYYRLSLFCDPQAKDKITEIKNRLDKLENLSENPDLPTENVRNFARALSTLTAPRLESTKSDSSGTTSGITYVPRGISADYSARVFPTNLKTVSNITMRFDEGTFIAGVEMGLARFIAKAGTNSSDGKEVKFIPFEPADERISSIMKTAVISLKDIFSGKIYDTITNSSFTYRTGGKVVFSDAKSQITLTGYTIDVVSFQRDGLKIEFDNYAFIFYGRTLKRLPRKIIVYAGNGKNKILELSAINIKFISDFAGDDKPALKKPAENLPLPDKKQ